MQKPASRVEEIKMTDFEYVEMGFCPRCKNKDTLVDDSENVLSRNPIVGSLKGCIACGWHGLVRPWGVVYANTK